MSAAGKSLHPAFIAMLEEHRDEINGRFKLTSLEGSPLDGQSFQKHLAQRVEPIVAAVHECLPERTRVTTLTLVTISLELFRAGFWGPQSRLPELDRLWEELLPKLARFVARDPERVVGSLSNALVNLTQQQTQQHTHQDALNPAHMATRWLQRMERVGETCTSVAELLDAGRVSAWLSGRADLRSVAIELLAKMPKYLTCKLFDINDAISDESLARILDRLRCDHWATVADAVACQSVAQSANERDGKLAGMQPRIVSRVGAFTGFGGQFQSPPTVALEAGQFFVSDAHSRWRLVADSFGAVLQRVPPASNSIDTREKSTNKKKTGNAISRQANHHAPQLSFGGDLTWGQDSLRLLQLAWPTSQAFDGQTLAVTLANSFHVILIASQSAVQSAPQSTGQSATSGPSPFGG